MKSNTIKRLIFLIMLVVGMLSITGCSLVTSGMEDVDKKLDEKASEIEDEVENGINEASNVGIERPSLKKKEESNTSEKINKKAIDKVKDVVSNFKKKVAGDDKPNKDIEKNKPDNKPEKNAKNKTTNTNKKPTTSDDKSSKVAIVNIEAVDKHTNKQLATKIFRKELSRPEHVEIPVFNIDGYSLESQRRVLLLSPGENYKDSVAYMYRKNTPDKAPSYTFTITVKTIDEDGNSVGEDIVTTKTIEKETAVSINIPKIKGYTLIEEISDKKELMLKPSSNIRQTVTFKYKKDIISQMFEFNIRAEDGDGKAIALNKKQSSYTTSVIDKETKVSIPTPVIDGYNLVSKIKTVTVIPGKDYEKTVIYKYDKKKEIEKEVFKFNIKAQDEDGKSIKIEDKYKSYETKELDKETSITVPTPIIDGYKLVGSAKVIKVSPGEKYDNEIIYKYKKEITSKPATVTIKARDSYNKKELSLKDWTSEKLTSPTSVLIPTPIIDGYELLDTPQSVTLKPGEKYKDIITYNYRIISVGAIVNVKCVDENGKELKSFLFKSEKLDGPSLIKVDAPIIEGYKFVGKEYWPLEPGKEYEKTYEYESTSKPATVNIKAIDKDTGQTLKTDKWKSAVLSKAIEVEVPAFNIDDYVLLGKEQIVKLEPGKEYKDEIIYEYEKESEMFTINIEARFNGKLIEVSKPIVKKINKDTTVKIDAPKVDGYTLIGEEKEVLLELGKKHERTMVYEYEFIPVEATVNIKAVNKKTQEIIRKSKWQSEKLNKETSVEIPIVNIDGYKAISSPKTITMIPGEVYKDEVVYEYEFIPIEATVNVKYQDEDGSEIKPDFIFKSDKLSSPSSIKIKAPIIDNYTLIGEEQSVLLEPGKMHKDTIVYKYKRNIEEFTINIKTISSGKSIQENEPIVKKINKDTTIKIDAPKIEGYTLIGQEQEVLLELGKELERAIIYEYSKSVIPEIFTFNITAKDDNGNNIEIENSIYKTEKIGEKSRIIIPAPIIDGYELMGNAKTVDVIPGEEYEKEVIYEYKFIPVEATVNIKAINKKTHEVIIITKWKSEKISKETLVEVPVVSIDGYRSISTPVKVKLQPGRVHKSEVVYEYEFIPLEATVNVEYRDEYGKELKSSSIFKTGKLDSPSLIKVDAAIIDNYTLVGGEKEVTLEPGKMYKDTIVYKYKRNIEEFIINIKTISDGKEIQENEPIVKKINKDTAIVISAPKIDGYTLISKEQEVVLKIGEEHERTIEYEYEKIIPSKVFNINVIAKDEYGKEIQSKIWTSEEIIEKTKVEILAPEIENYTLVGDTSKIIDLDVDVEDIKELIFEYQLNKITNQKELRSEFIRELKDRPSVMNVNYYGKDITGYSNFSKFISELQNSGTYHTNNMNNINYHVYGSDKHFLYKDGAYNINIVSMSYRTTDSQEAFIDKEVKRIVGSEIEENMGQFDKVKAIHDYIVERKIYTMNTTNPQNAYGFFEDGKGVCHAFALSAARMFDEVGIENYFVLGRATSNGKTELHTWNKVKIDGQWYNIDTTWSHNDNRKYDYFLLSDKELHKTHTPDYTKYEPKATDTRYDKNILNNISTLSYLLNNNSDIVEKKDFFFNNIKY